MLMARAGIRGRPRWKRPRLDLIAKGLVDRDFARSEPNQLWVTDIERHEALLNRVEVGDLRRRVVAAAR
jgi:transposase InsO family protein